MPPRLDLRLGELNIKDPSSKGSAWRSWLELVSASVPSGNLRAKGDLNVALSPQSKSSGRGVEVEWKRKKNEMLGGKGIFSGVVEEGEGDPG